MKILIKTYHFGSFFHGTLQAPKTLQQQSIGSINCGCCTLQATAFYIVVTIPQEWGDKEQ